MLSRDSLINLLHIFVIVPLLFCLYFYKDSLTPTICNIIIAIAIAGMGYHLYRLVKNSESDKMQEWKMTINVIHIMLIFPLLIYIGLKCKEAKRYYYELLLILIFASLGYNMYNFVMYS
jgi:hypothetical protein